MCNTRAEGKLWKRTHRNIYGQLPPPHSRSSYLLYLSWKCRMWLQGLQKNTSKYFHEKSTLRAKKIKVWTQYIYLRKLCKRRRGSIPLSKVDTSANRKCVHQNIYRLLGHCIPSDASYNIIIAIFRYAMYCYIDTLLKCMMYAARRMTH